MLDIKWILENKAALLAGAKKKRMEVDVDGLIAAYERLKEARQTSEAAAAEANAAAKEIPTLQGEAKEKRIAEMKAKRQEMGDLKESVRVLEEEYTQRMLRVPNIPDAAVPEGATDADNVENKRVGELPKFDFTPKSHLELGELHDMIDIPRGVKIAGTRNYFLKNAAALLEMSVLRMSLDYLVSQGFIPMLVPQLVRDEAMTGTAYFPGGEEQAYRIERDQLNLVGTSEVSLCYYHADEILNKADLPLRYCGFSACYRREAGAAGKDTKGLYRIHQFHKIEQVILCQNDPDVSRAEHELLLKNSETILQMLELPYRVVDVCGGDLGMPQVKKYDVETWMPSRDSYGETHSCSMIYDYQARRLNMRYKNDDNRTVFCHTLNNTAIASPRILIPLLECHQQKDGSIRIPKALQSYMGGKEVIEPK